MKLNYLDSNNSLLFTASILGASYLILLYLNFEQNSTRHRKLYLTVRYCLNGYYTIWGYGYIPLFINLFILMNEAMSLYKIVSGLLLLFP